MRELFSCRKNYTFLLRISFIFIFIFIICLLSNNRIDLVFQSCFTKDVEDKILHSRLILDNDGEVRPVFMVQSECYRLNSTASGVNKFVRKDSLNKTQCKEVKKRFMKGNETHYRVPLKKAKINEDIDSNEPGLSSQGQRMGFSSVDITHSLEICPSEISADKQVTFADLKTKESGVSSPNCLTNITGLIKYDEKPNVMTCSFCMKKEKGIHTGSLYPDILMNSSFKGKETTEGVSVVKTHYTVFDHIRFFNRAVLIIRDPFESTLSEYNRKGAHSKTRIIPEEMFSIEYITKLLPPSITQWQQFYEDWMVSFPGPVFVIFYDKLKSDLKNSMAKLCLFLDIPVTIQDLSCMELRQEGVYHRSPKPEYMSRSKIVTSYIENQIKNATSKLVEICTKPENTNKIKSNL